jgi:endoglucanase
MVKTYFSHLLALLVLCTAFGLLWQPARAETSAAQAVLPFLHAQGDQLTSPNNRPVLLKGCNLGNWMVIEPWMLGGTIQAIDQVQIFTTLRERFGNQRGQELIDLYRDRYITDRDFALIKSFGFNVVRLPFDYRILQEDAPPFAIKSDAFHWLDKALDMAERAGVYVILDLHGVPGGQSEEMHTGQAGQNHFWDSAVDHDRTVAIWHAIAQRYHDRSVVAAYDLINEPYGNHQQDVRDDLARLLPRLYAAVRSVDSRHIMFAPGALNGGIEFYGNPHDHGWQNVGFTEHYYAGLFGDKAALESHAQVLNLTFPAKRAQMQQWATPYYVGEFNVVLEANGGPRVMRAYYDWFAKAGWPATMWSYKLLKTQGGAGPDAWYMDTNADPLPMLDLKSATYVDFEQFFSSLGTMNLAINERLRKALTEPHPFPLPLTQYPPALTRAPATDAAVFATGPLAGFAANEIGGAKKGAVTSDGEGTFSFWASGSDIFSTSDSFDFLSKPARDNSELSIRLLSLRQTDPWAKAGVMARWGNAANAAFAMINAFPDGTIAFCNRSVAGASTSEIKRFAELPVDLKIVIVNGKAKGLYRSPDDSWQQFGSADVPHQSNYQIGLAVTSHAPGLFTIARMQFAPPAGILDRSANATLQLLHDGSFENAGTWNSWGDSMQRQTNPSLARTGTASILCGQSATYSGLWQDAKTLPGQRYTFNIWAKSLKLLRNDSGTIELRLEAPQGDHPIILNSSTFSPADLPLDGHWSRLSVSATAINRSTRALIIYAPTQSQNMADLDDAQLVSNK